jgi:hypothetical protein
VNRLPRVRDPNRDKAFLIFKEHNGNIANRTIAEQLGVLEKTISAWKNRDKWLSSLPNVKRSTTKPKRSTTQKRNTNENRSSRKKQVIDALLEAGTYSPALDLLIEIYLDAYEEYMEQKTEKLRKELAKYLGQLGLDGKNKELIKSGGKLLAKGEEENQKEKEIIPENNKLLEFRQRRKVKA